jgi:putative membrane protein
MAIADHPNQSQASGSGPTQNAEMSSGAIRVPDRRRGTAPVDPADGGASADWAAPDPRVTFANERTFLAWNRTALALVAGGLAVSQLVKVGSGGAALTVALALVAFGAFMSFTGYRHWKRNERAIRLRQPIMPSALPRFLACGVAGFAVAAAALAILRLVS